MVDPDLYDEFIACNRSTDFFPYSIFQRLTWLASWPRDVVLEVQKICANEVCPRKMRAAHSGSKCWKLARNSFLLLFQCDFTNVKWSKAIFSISVSGTRMNFIYKSCPTVAGRSMIDQFHESINSIFGAFLKSDQTVRRRTSQGELPRKPAVC